MHALENDAANMCFGCGPANPNGLGLAFEVDGEEVVTRFTPKPEQTGWPGNMHIGLHFTVLCETAYWTLLGATGHIGTADELQYSVKRLPPVGEESVFRGRVVSVEDGVYHIESRSTGPDGRPCGSVMSRWRPLPRKVAERIGLELPDHLHEHLA